MLPQSQQPLFADFGSAGVDRITAIGRSLGTSQQDACAPADFAQERAEFDLS